MTNFILRGLCAFAGVMSIAESKFGGHDAGLATFQLLLGFLLIGVAMLADEVTA